MVKTWDGLMEYAEDAKQASSYAESMTTWATGTYDKALNGITVGDNSLVPKAESLLDKLDATIELPTRHWEASMAGAYPIVAEFLAGSPTPMRRMVEVESDNSPIAIYVSTTCSAGISESVMLDRGVAILALLMKMQQLRPINLYLMAETDGYKDNTGVTIQVIRIESTPLDLSVACFALSRVVFARQITYSMARKLNGFSGGWPRGYNYDDGREWEVKVRDMVGMNPNDLYIPAAKSWDQMVTDPITWVNAQVQRFIGRDDE